MKLLFIAFACMAALLLGARLRRIHPLVGTLAAFLILFWAGLTLTADLQYFRTVMNDYPVSASMIGLAAIGSAFVLHPAERERADFRFVRRAHVVLIGRLRNLGVPARHARRAWNGLSIVLLCAILALAAWCMPWIDVRRDAALRDFDREAVRLTVNVAPLVDDVVRRLVEKAPLKAGSIAFDTASAALDEQKRAATTELRTVPALPERLRAAEGQVEGIAQGTKDVLLKLLMDVAARRYQELASEGLRSWRPALAEAGAAAVTAARPDLVESARTELAKTKGTAANARTQELLASLGPRLSAVATEAIEAAARGRLSGRSATFLAESESLARAHGESLVEGAKRDMAAVIGLLRKEVAEAARVKVQEEERSRLEATKRKQEQEALAEAERIKDPAYRTRKEAEQRAERLRELDRARVDATERYRKDEENARGNAAFLEAEERRMDAEWKKIRSAAVEELTRLGFEAVDDTWWSWPYLEREMRASATDCALACLKAACSGFSFQRSLDTFVNAGVPGASLPEKSMCYLYTGPLQRTRHEAWVSGRRR